MGKIEIFYIPEDFSIITFGGVGVDKQHNLEVNVTSLNPNHPPCKLPNFPIKIMGAASILLPNNTLMICGGFRNDNMSKDCTILSGNKWITTIKMLEPRYVSNSSLESKFFIFRKALKIKPLP